MTRDDLAIMPRPQSVSFQRGVYRLPGRVNILASASAAGELWFLKRALKKAGSAVADMEIADGKGVFVGVGSRARQAPSPHTRPNGAEGYTLTIDGKGIWIEANTATGLFWGMQSLAQLLEDSTRLPALRISDYPDLAMRGIHLDLKGTFPTRARLWKWVEILASYKINCVLVEYEDKIEYSGDPAFVSPYALSKKEARRFVKLCAKRHIQVVPLLQCLGHAEYILRFPEYRRLRELPTRFDQFCPSKPGTLEMFAQCAEELADLHPDCEWFHVGADETRVLGQCPVCKKRAAKQGNLGIYLEHLRRVFEVVHGLGMKPIFWDDMLTRHDKLDELDRLPGEYAVAYWDYGTDNPERFPSLLLRDLVQSEQWLYMGRDRARYLDAPNYHRATLERGLPDDVQRLYDKNKRYYQIEESPLYFSSFCHIGPLQEKGVNIIGCAGARTSANQRIPLPGAARNVRAWAQAAKRRGLMGSIATSWSRSHSLGALPVTLEDSWYAHVAAAEFYWSADTEMRDYDRRFSIRFMGLDDTRAIDLMYTLEESPQDRGSIAESIADEFPSLIRAALRNKTYLRQLHFLARVERVRRFIVNEFVARKLGQFTPLNPSAALAPVVAEARHGAREHLAMLTDLRKEGLRLYKLTLHEHEARERMEALIRPIEALLEGALREIKSAANKAKRRAIP